MPHDESRMSEFTRGFREGQREAIQENKDAEALSQLEFGNDRKLWLGSANQALRAMSPAERQKYEDGYGSSGLRALNDPEIIRDLALRAVGPIPTSEKDRKLELQLLRDALRRDRAGHFKNPARQLRMALLAQGQGIGGRSIV